ncbi:MAG: cytochrome c family protein [Campylobacter sp.]|nr:cytochrome c family protein [Campylobacter sp.]
MKKILLLFLFLTCCVAYPNVIERFVNPNNCVLCHEQHVKDWKTSLHSQSHEDSNELFRESVKFISKELRQPYENTVVSCGDCHNPRFDIKSVEDDYMIAKNFGIEASVTKKVEGAIDAEHIKNGISCYVCHNVNSINPKNNNQGIGYKLINWTEDSTIVGPHDDENNRAKFHLSSSREFFKTNELCLICHQGNGVSNNRLSAYNTGVELSSSSDDRRCIDCHMGEPKMEIISPNAPGAGEATPKHTRAHTFTGARNDLSLLRDALNIDFESLNRTNANLILENLISHNFPSGFSGRSLWIEITFLSSGKPVGEPKVVELKATYFNKSGLETLSYAATSLKDDTRLEPFELRKIPIEIPVGVNEIKIDVAYYLLTPSLQRKMDIKDEKYTKKYELASKIFKLQ